MSDWVKYNNGNYTVAIDLSNGTKVRYNKEDKFVPTTIENFDYKITNRCDMNCLFCFESSSVKGKHADIMNQKFIDSLHPYTEISIGGGNPLCHPQLIQFLEKCKKLKLIPNITVNQIHFERNQELIERLVSGKLVYGVGVSLVEPTQSFIELVKKYSNVVIHVINGVITEHQLNMLYGHNLKILVLGYKELGRGESLYRNVTNIIDDRKDMLKHSIEYMIKNKMFNVVSFDNRALQQLDIKSILPKEQWDVFYMGDDGIDGEYTSASMFIDGVKEQFALNSCSSKRYKLMDNINDMFAFLKKENNREV